MLTRIAAIASDRMSVKPIEAGNAKDIYLSSFPAMIFWIAARMKPIMRKPPAGRIIMTIGLEWKNGTAMPFTPLT